VLQYIVLDIHMNDFQSNLSYLYEIFMTCCAYVMHSTVYSHGFFVFKIIGDRNEARK
jgi:hypothetical protein